MEPTRRITEMCTFEDRLAEIRTAMAAAPTRGAFRDADYAELRSLLMQHAITRAVQRVFDNGLRNLTDERVPNAADVADLAKAEERMAWARAVLAKEGLSNDTYVELRHFVLEFPIARVFRRVLDAATRILADERNDAAEFALPINIV